MLNYLLFVIAITWTPGPNTLSVMANTARTGIKGGLPYIGGIMTAQYAAMTICLVFSAVLESFLAKPAVSLALRIIGALYMVYLAYKQFRTAALPEAAVKKGTFGEGFLLCIGNMKYYLAALLSLNNYGIPAANGRFGVLFLYALVFVLLCNLALVPWGCFGAALKKFYAKHIRLMSVLFGILLLYCAVKFFL